MSRMEKEARERWRTKHILYGTLLLLAGASLALFPFFTNVYSKHILGAAEVEPVAVEIREVDASPAISVYEEALERFQREKLGEVPAPAPQELIEGLEGVLEIPALDLQVKVIYGVELDDLRKAPGFYPQSQYPGQGNVSIAGHRTTYGAWFRHLDRLEEGDELILRYDNQVFRFQLWDVFAIHNRDWNVIDPTEWPALTLTTCHPPGWATQRLVARAYLVDEDSLPHHP